MFIKFALVFFAIGFSLVVSEFLLRVVSLQAAAVDSAEKNKVFMEYDPLLGWRPPPNHRGVVTSPFDEFRVVQEINSRGIRSPEYPFENKWGELRILMRGDSFTQGDMVPFKELSSEVLKARLNDAGPGTHEVINAGTSGYSTDQELVFLQSEEKRLYFVKDGHWNPLRHKVAGEILAKHVLSNHRGKSKGGTPMVLRRRDRVAAS